MRTRRTRTSSDPMPLPQGGHRSVLLSETIGALDIAPHDTIVDATLGAAGHARAIAERLESGGTLVGFDADKSAISRAEHALSGVRPQVVLIEANFRHMAKELAARGITTIDGAVFDLGWSSDQLSAGRGFSFLSDDPLLMTYAADPEGMLTAETIVNRWEESSLADIIYGFGEERYARRIARRIVEMRDTRPFKTARELAEAVAEAVPRSERGRLHPATKTFQALRIAVNDELGAIQEGVRGAWSLLRQGGRIAVISFHSVEDRAVKRLFASWEAAGEGKRLTKKPVVAGAEELQVNPRARSAKLRTIEKI